MISYSSKQIFSHYSIDKDIQSKRVLITGMGEVGQHLVKFLVRDSSSPEIFVGDIDQSVVEKKSIML